MKRFLLGGLTLVLAALPAPAGARTPEQEVTAWILPSASPRLVARNAADLTTLSVVGIGLRADGASTSSPTRAMRRLALAGHRHGLTTELLVSNYSDALGDFDRRALHRMLSHPARIRQVADQVARIVGRGPWDGVNVDLERVRESDGAGLVAFVARLQQAMPAARTVSIDISATSSVRGYRQRGYRLADLAREVDVIDLMAYDYSGPTWTGPGPIGPLAWQRASVRALRSRVPARMIQLGVAGYGYTWPTEGTGRSITPRGARRMVQDDGADATFNREYGEWTATLSNGTVLWWSDARSYQLRAGLAERLGLRGTAVWRLGSADPLGGS
ncbi:hydrolase [Nocardioides humilatus]|uniref:Hydrolase n=1 Tax=Nocardioides humilatus TaxID=2607660 RepID=A0A5B1LNB2_9ACTN|nr:glycosyl hydrolase family 18 protein [Nocardioides humilatus]KAA1421598.1 hydrolase [Nocardioides humilatus]